MCPNWHTPYAMPVLQTQKGQPLDEIASERAKEWGKGQQRFSDLKIENQETKDSMQLLQLQIKCKEWHIIT